MTNELTTSNPFSQFHEYQYLGNKADLLHRFQCILQIHGLFPLSCMILEYSILSKFHPIFSSL